MTPPTAYCAPGRKGASAIALALQGQDYGEITEHPWLEGRTDVLLVYPEALQLGRPERYPWDPEFPDCRDPVWWQRQRLAALGDELRAFVNVTPS